MAAANLALHFILCLASAGAVSLREHRPVTGPVSLLQAAIPNEINETFETLKRPDMTKVLSGDVQIFQETWIPAFKDDGWGCDENVVPSCVEKKALMGSYETMNQSLLISDAKNWAPFLVALDTVAPSIGDLFNAMGVDSTAGVTRKSLSAKINYEVPQTTMDIADIDKDGALSYDELADYVMVASGLAQLFEVAKVNLVKWLDWSCTSAGIPPVYRPPGVDFSKGCFGSGHAYSKRTQSYEVAHRVQFLANGTVNLSAVNHSAA